MEENIAICYKSWLAIVRRKSMSPQVFLLINEKKYFLFDR